MVEPQPSGMTADSEVPRPRLAVALAAGLRTAPAVHDAVAEASHTLGADVALYCQLAELPTAWRVVLRRAESEAMDKLCVGLSPGGAHRIDVGTGQEPAGQEPATGQEPGRIIVVHGDGWSLVGRTPAVLAFVLDAAPDTVIDRSAADGAEHLVRGLAAQFG